MNKFAKWIGVVVVMGALALASAAVALAAPEQQSGAAAQATAGARHGGPGGRMGGQAAGEGILAQYDDLAHAEIAKALGLSVSDFEAAIASGQTAYSLAIEKGVDAATLQVAMQAGHAAALEQAVADGVVTQAQADWMAQRAGGPQAARGGNFGSSCPLGVPAAPGN